MSATYKYSVEELKALFDWILENEKRARWLWTESTVATGEMKGHYEQCSKDLRWKITKTVGSLFYDLPADPSNTSSAHPMSAP